MKLDLTKIKPGMRIGARPFELLASSLSNLPTTAEKSTPEQLALCKQVAAVAEINDLREYMDRLQAHLLLAEGVVAPDLVAESMALTEALARKAKVRIGIVAVEIKDALDLARDHCRMATDLKDMGDRLKEGGNQTAADFQYTTAKEYEAKAGCLVSNALRDTH